MKKFFIIASFRFITAGWNNASTSARLLFIYLKRDTVIHNLMIDFIGCKGRLIKPDYKKGDT